jgi:hypothetical protein
MDTTWSALLLAVLLGIFPRQPGASALVITPYAIP